MRIFISTGEVSGDLQGSLLVSALKRQADSIFSGSGCELEIVALGGDKMAAAGATLLGNTAGIGSLGLLEVLPYVVPTYKLQQKAFTFLKQNPPDVVVLIDYMGPNLAIAKFIRRHLSGTPIFYYIAPQAWAASLKIITNQTTREVVEVSDKILAIFPEEARYYRKHGAKVTWVGHPLIDRINEFPTREAARAKLGITEDDICVALLPASRQQELEFLLPTIFATAKEIQLKLPQVHFWIPLSLEKFHDAIAQSIQDYNLNATIVSGQNQEVLAAADLAITKCGTVNLELALLNVPQVVLYKLSKLSYWIAQNILKLSLPFASPPNLVMMQPIVPEFIQEKATPENLTQAAMELLLNPERKAKIQADYREMRQALGENGVCDRVAQEILGGK
jgi:lipid-A-disaccharide synthase